MRALADSDRIERFMREFGRAAPIEGRVYLTGGSTAVLQGWRDSTIDVDIKLIPDRDELLQAIPRLKQELDLNIEPLLYRFPDIDPASFRAAVEELF